MKIRRYATVGLLTIVLGCGYRPAIEMPDNPAPPPPEAILPVAREGAQEPSTDSQYEFNFNLASVVDGEMVSSSQLRGWVLIADFWGTWCGPCRAEVPHLVKLHDKYRAQGLEIVGLTYERDGDEVAQIDRIKQFVAEHDIHYPCVVGDNRTREQVPDFHGYPTKVFIDRQGKVRLTLVGSQSFEKMETVVLTLLEED